MDLSKYIHVIYPLKNFSFTDYPDNISYSLLIYLLGCGHNCFNCQNPELQNSKNTKIKNIFIHANTLMHYIDQACKEESQIDNIVITGGDPLFQNNLYFTKKFCEEYGEKYNIAIYTGASIDFVKENSIKNFKYIKCGQYIEELKQEIYKNDYEIQLASSNQEWYDSNYKQISQNGLLKFY